MKWLWLLPLAVLACESGTVLVPVRGKIEIVGEVCSDKNRATDTLTDITLDLIANGELKNSASFAYIKFYHHWHDGTSEDSGWTWWTAMTYGGGAYDTADFVKCSYTYTSPSSNSWDTITTELLAAYYWLGEGAYYVNAEQNDTIGTIGSGEIDFDWTLQCN